MKTGKSDFELLAKDPIRVLLLDNKTLIRGLIAKMIAEDPDIELISSVPDYNLGLRAIANKDIEVVVLDIDANENKQEDLDKFFKAQSDLQIIATSSLSKTSEGCSKAKRSGAVDCITKPGSAEIMEDIKFKEELFLKIKKWGLLKRKGLSEKPEEIIKYLEKTPINIPKFQKSPLKQKIECEKVKKNANLVVDVIAIGSSTGGPQALAKVFEGLRDVNISQPIFITQHMPPNFTKTLAGHLQKIIDKPCQEGEEGMIVEGGQIYIAPGGFHMSIEGMESGKKRIKLLDTPPENFCKPSVEPMMRSIIKAYKGKILEVVLTGMGNDGHVTAKEVVEAGGEIIVQDQETSVVWGMPGVIANSGLSSDILPIDEIAPYIIKVAARR